MISDTNGLILECRIDEWIGTGISQSDGKSYKQYEQEQSPEAIEIQERIVSIFIILSISDEWRQGNQYDTDKSPGADERYAGSERKESLKDLQGIGEGVGSEQYPGKWYEDEGKEGSDETSFLFLWMVKEYLMYDQSQTIYYSP